MKSECGGNERKKTNLNHGVVEHRCLSLSSWSIAVLELAADSAVASGDCHTASKDATGLHDDG